MKSLDVLVDERLIGILHNKEPLTFVYSEDCLGGLIRNPFAYVIPLSTGDIATPEVLAYFENLLPEGDQRLALQQKYHVSTVFGLLSKVGWDTAGSVVLRPTGTIEENSQYIKKSWADISRIISGQGIQSDSSKVSISGAQYKILLSLDDDGDPLLPVGSTPSTHILKPDIKREGQQIWASAINETILMRMAAKCGLPVASVRYIESVKSCLVRRYDRDIKDGNVLRIGQSDLCQLLKKPSSVKYEIDGGPNFSSCYFQVKSTSTNPVIDCENLVKWIFFNLYTGNNDSHAKNLSMLQEGGGYKLAPFYDLMCTTIYSGFSSNFSFKIGSTFKPGEVDKKQLNTFAKSIGASGNFILKVATDMYERIVPAMEQSINEIYATLGSSEKLMVEKLIYEISRISKKRISKFLDISPSAKVAKERSTRALEFIQSLKGKQDSIKDIDKLI